MRLADRDMFLDKEKVSYHYGKVTSDKRLLIGYGDVENAQPITDGLHVPHVENIERFVERAFGITNALEYAWSAEYALSYGALPIVLVEPTSAKINGAGTQLATIAIASYAVSALLGRQHPLESLFVKL